MVTYKTLKTIALLLIIIGILVNTIIYLSTSGGYSDFGLVFLMLINTLIFLSIVVALFFVKGKEKNDNDLKWIK